MIPDSVRRKEKGLNAYGGQPGSTCGSEPEENLEQYFSRSHPSFGISHLYDVDAGINVEVAEANFTGGIGISLLP